MCGIAGAFGLKGQPVDAERARTMAATLVHRGPDEAGAWAGSNVAFAFRRLSFLDLVGGNQPLANEDGSVHLICNGEIFNYRELRDELQKKGHQFRTNTDVEVIVHLYEEEGAQMVNRLEGQFAIAIHDAKRESLLLARDPFGVCPLFFSVVGDELLFASTINALLTDDRLPREVDLVALDQVLTFPGLLSPRTIVAGIKSVPAGHLVEVRHGRVSLTEYWDLVFPTLDEREPVDEEAAIDELLEALENSVARRLHADVPIGYYLSGGLDSAIVAHLIDRRGPRRRHSFSIAFEDPDYDEARHQRKLAARLRAEHHEALMTPGDVDRLLQQAVLHSACPLKESYNTASLVLSKAARDAGVPGVLTGEGADELFAGYVGHRFDVVRRQRGRRGDSSAEEEAVRVQLWGDADVFYEKEYAPHRSRRRWLYDDDLAGSHDDFDCTLEPVVDPTRMKGRHHVDQRCYLDFRLRLTDHLVADHGDRMAMANSVEARYPFLDLTVASIATRLPPELKLRGFTEKYALRRVAERLGVPRSIVDREKFHFVAPSSASLLQGRSELVEHLLAPSTIKSQGFFDAEAVASLADRNRQPDFRLSLPFEDDELMVILTFTCLVDELGLAHRT